MRKLLLVSLVFGLVTVLQVASATATPLLLGGSVRIDTVDGIVISTATATVVDPGVEFPLIGAATLPYRIDVFDTFFDIHPLDTVGSGSSTHTITLTALSPTIPAFTSATVDFITNVPGFGSGRVSFTPTTVTLDTHSLNFNPDQVIRIDLAAAPTAVPEPASLLLLGPGLISAGARRWRNRRQHS
jgi:hypothetical protein